MNAISMIEANIKATAVNLEYFRKALINTLNRKSTGKMYEKMVNLMEEKINTMEEEIQIFKIQLKRHKLKEAQKNSSHTM